MILYLLILVVLCFWGVKFSNFHTDYMGKEATTSIKGMFAVIILFSHIRSYMDLTSWGDTLYNTIISCIGQLMVAPFFFYSGYGIYESCKRNNNYAYGFFRKRVLKTLLHFDIAVLLFILSEFLLSHYYSIENYIFCWVGWESVGNSNWFIFDILMLYFITYITLSLRRNGGGDFSEVDLYANSAHYSVFRHNGLGSEGCMVV